VAAIFARSGGAGPQLQEDVDQVQVTVTNTEEKLTIDFTGTSARSGGFANCGIGGLKSGALAGLLEMRAAGIDWNAGLLAHLKIASQPGTINNPKLPAAVSDGITEGAVAAASAVSAAVGNMSLGSALGRGTVSFNGANTFLANTLAGIDENGRVRGTLLMDGIGLCSSGNECRDGLELARALAGSPTGNFRTWRPTNCPTPSSYLFRRVGKRRRWVSKGRQFDRARFRALPCPVHIDAALDAWGGVSQRIGHSRGLAGERGPFWTADDCENR